MLVHSDDVKHLVFIRIVFDKIKQGKSYAFEGTQKEN